MKRTELIMGMPITLEIVGSKNKRMFDKIFAYFRAVDARYSPYKKDSELSQINRGLSRDKWSSEMSQVMDLCEETKSLSGGYFDINSDGQIDPSGLVKGWAINNAANLLKDEGVNDFYIEAGGDIQISGKNEKGDLWSVGIRNPFNIDEIVKVLMLSDAGIATSGTYLRGEHIYNPHDRIKKPEGIKSLTVIGPNVYEADRFATAAFAMGGNGIGFINALPGFEGYMIDDDKRATYTKGFDVYVVEAA